MKAVKDKIIQIILLFIIIIIVGWIVYVITGYDIYQEDLTFLPPDDCSAVCDVNTTREYCNSPWQKDGPNALCDCHWNDEILRCEGKLAQ